MIRYLDNCYKTKRPHKIVKEWLASNGTATNNSGMKYEINGIDLTKVVFFWREKGEKFQPIPKGNYVVSQENNITYITIHGLKDVWEYQAIYVDPLKSSTYDDKFPELAVLVRYYNELQKDVVNLMEQWKSVGAKVDTDKMSQILPELEKNCVWVGIGDGLIGSIPFADLNSKFEKMLKQIDERIKNQTDKAINELKKIIEEYKKSFKDDLAKEYEKLVKDLEKRKNDLLKQLQDLINSFNGVMSVVKNGNNLVITKRDGSTTTIPLAQNIDTSQFITKTNLGSEIDKLNKYLTRNQLADELEKYVLKGEYQREISNIKEQLKNIKKIKIGSIQTDSRGSGTVNFSDFKQPISVITSIKSFNGMGDFGIGSVGLNAYAELVSGTTYNFFIKGIRDFISTQAPPATSTTNNGKTWTINNLSKTELTGITGTLPAKSLTVSVPITKKETQIKNYKQTDTYKATKVPTYNVKVNRVDGSATTTVYSENFTLGYNIMSFNTLRKTDLKVNYNQVRTGKLTAFDFKIDIGEKNLNKAFNVVKNFSNATNVKYEIVITITQPYLEVEISGMNGLDKNAGGSGDNDDHITFAYSYKGNAFTLTDAMFSNWSITAKNTPSAIGTTLDSTSGNEMYCTGEVSYIAMEL